MCPARSLTARPRAFGYRPPLIITYSVGRAARTPGGATTQRAQRAVAMPTTQAELTDASYRAMPCFHCLGPNDPAIYCCCRPACEGFVNSCLLPFLGSACGKVLYPLPCHHPPFGLLTLSTAAQCLIANCFGPIYHCCDKIQSRDEYASDRPAGVDSAKAVVVLQRVMRGQLVRRRIRKLAKAARQQPATESDA